MGSAGADFPGILCRMLLPIPQGQNYKVDSPGLAWLREAAVDVFQGALFPKLVTGDRPGPDLAFCSFIAHGLSGYFVVAIAIYLGYYRLIYK